MSRYFALKTVRLWERLCCQQNQSHISSSVRPEASVGKKNKNDCWDWTRNPPMWLGGYGNQGSYSVKHVAKMVLRKPGDSGVAFKACPGRSGDSYGKITWKL
eukprot:6294335-Amphidinium_carterae.2